MAVASTRPHRALLAAPTDSAFRAQRLAKCPDCGRGHLVKMQIVFAIMLFENA